MSKRISEEERNEIKRLYDNGNGFPPAEIAKRTGFDYHFIYRLTKLKQLCSPKTGKPFTSYYEYEKYLVKQKGFESPGQYRNYLARQKGFESYVKYQEHLARQKGFASRTEYQEHLLKQKGFKSQYEYKEYLARQKGFESYAKYQEHLLKQRGFASQYEYQEHLAKQKGFESCPQYRAHLLKEYQKNPKNQKLANLIRQRLNDLEKSQNWLSRQFGDPRPNISRYVNAKHFPSGETLQKLCSFLDIPQKTLDDLLEDN